MPLEKVQDGLRYLTRTEDLMKDDSFENEGASNCLLIIAVELETCLVIRNYTSRGNKRSSGEIFPI
jgi:hypothetical protein